VVEARAPDRLLVYHDGEEVTTMIAQEVLPQT
jgi:hypothetical protein